MDERTFYQETRLSPPLCLSYRATVILCNHESEIHGLSTLLGLVSHSRRM